MKSKKPTEKSTDKKGDKKSDKTVKSAAPQPYENEITNKLKESLRKSLQATKGFPEKLKTVPSGLRQRIAEVQKEKELSVEIKHVRKDETQEAYLGALASKHSFLDQHIKVPRSKPRNHILRWGWWTD
jgi:hypothetical protein